MKRLLLIAATVILCNSLGAAQMDCTYLVTKPTFGAGMVLCLGQYGTLTNLSTATGLRSPLNGSYEGWSLYSDTIPAGPNIQVLPGLGLVSPDLLVTASQPPGNVSLPITFTYTLSDYRATWAIKEIVTADVAANTLLFKMTVPALGPSYTFGSGYLIRQAEPRPWPDGLGNYAQTNASAFAYSPGI